MRFLHFILGVMAAVAADAFVPPSGQPLPSTTRSFGQSTVKSAATESCGCGEVVMSGKPTDKAKAVNAREVIGKYSVSNASGRKVAMNDLVGKQDSGDVSIVVFLRSLG